MENEKGQIAYDKWESNSIFVYLCSILSLLKINGNVSSICTFEFLTCTLVKEQILPKWKILMIFIAKTYKCKPIIKNKYFYIFVV